MSHAAAVHAACQMWCSRAETLSFGAEVAELRKCDQGTTTEPLASAWADSDPVDLACDLVTSRLLAEAADSDDCIEPSRSYHAHAVLGSEAAVRVWVIRVCSLVDEDSHCWLLILRGSSAGRTSYGLPQMPSKERRPQSRAD